jgi:hypothetical protein
VVWCATPGELDAVLCGRNAEQLLGMKACDFTSNPDQLQQLQDVVARITRICPRGEGAAWLDLALTSLYPEGVEGELQQKLPATMPCMTLRF